MTLGAVSALSSPAHVLDMLFGWGLGWDLPARLSLSVEALSLE